MTLLCTIFLNWLSPVGKCVPFLKCSSGVSERGAWGPDHRRQCSDAHDRNPHGLHAKRRQVEIINIFSDLTKNIFFLKKICYFWEYGPGDCDSLSSDWSPSPDSMQLILQRKVRKTSCLVLTYISSFSSTFDFVLKMIKKLTGRENLVKAFRK